MNADVDPSTAKSRTGFVITYGACPIVWASKLQTEVALSTSESEYNALSTATCDVMFLMQLVSEARKLKWKVFDGAPTVHCKVFEDNSGALEMARLPRMRLRTKHLCARLHHFREHARNKKISINKTATEKQLGDLQTKPQPEDLFISQRESLMQWDAEFMTKDELTRSAHHLRACDISDSAESLCLVQHEKAEREKARRDKAKLASKGILLNDPADRLILLNDPADHLSTDGTHVLPVNDGVHQNIIQIGSKIGNGKIDVERSNACLDDGWKQVSRHENTKKRLARIEGNKATD